MSAKIAPLHMVWDPFSKKGVARGPTPGGPGLALALPGVGFPGETLFSALHSGCL